ncbi:MAG: AAA family ATPase [Clostridiales bacterium]|nr:AAA family ATPase [Clostridiales bacterium]
MERGDEMQAERAYLRDVQRMLLLVIGQSKEQAGFQDETMRMMLADAWDELRMKPTALSPQDLMQLNAELDRFTARKIFSQDRAARYQRMLMAPYFARVDFAEDGEEVERIVIGLYSLKDERGRLMVHDWRAPVCSLYYDSLPGPASYQSPSGEIRGEMALKRQYAMEHGSLKYYVDTELSIDDGMLLDILSGATSGHMRQIVATIQLEQNAAIRHESSRVLSVVGGAGSGKTSVALHRAAYLMYRHREAMDASAIAVMSPSDSFAEYISRVLPELGEENCRTMMLHDVIAPMVDGAVERPAEQAEALLRPEADARRRGVRLKSGERLVRLLDAFADRFKALGPRFDDVMLRRNALTTKVELQRLYREQFAMLTPAQRLTRIQAIMDSRLAEWEKALYPQYESQFMASYRGRELEFATRMAVTQQLHPIRSQLKRMLSPRPYQLYAMALRDGLREFAQAAAADAEAGHVSWEDAPGIAYLMLKLGFARPDTSVRHLLIDEAQDYADVALRFMRLCFPKAHVTLLGDPNQRTLPGLPECKAEKWGGLMDQPDAPLVKLSLGYRCTVEINDFCNGLIQRTAQISFGRNGPAPARLPYSAEALNACLADWRAAGHRRVAVIARTQADAARLKKALPGARLLLSDEFDRDDGLVVTCAQLAKGMEYDAVAVVWPRLEEDEGERRRLYTACSRALHALNLYIEGETDDR